MDLTPDEIYYRYYDNSSPGFRPFLSEHKVTRRTPKGLWVLEYDGGEDEKFILNSANKKFAAPTKELALEAYIARKKRQIEILSAQHDVAVLNLKAAETGKDQNNYDWGGPLFQLQS